MIVAIDMGVNSPAVCILDGNKFHFYFFPKLKKHIGVVISHKGNKAYLGIDTPHYIFTALQYPDYTSREQRYDSVASIIHSTILSHIGNSKDNKIFIEGYAFGVTKSRSSSGLYEIGGIIRNKLYLSGFSYTEIPPTSLKKVFTGHGNSNKFTMGLFFEEYTGIDLFKLFDVKRGKTIPKPLEDIQDSGAMVGFDYMKNNVVVFPYKDKKIVGRSKIVGNIIKKMSTNI